MNAAWDSIADDVQGYIARGIRPLPFVYAQFLEALMEKERAQLLCLLPSPRFEAYHNKLERKVRARSDSQRRAA